jgi:hypothetical protein
VCGLGANISLLTCTIIIFFHLASNVLSTTLHTKLGISHPLVLGVWHYICRRHLDPMEIHLFSLHSWWGEDDFAYCYMRCFWGHCERYKNSWLAKVDPYPFTHCPTIFAPSNWHCAISWWCSHVGRCCHYGPHSSWFGFTILFLVRLMWQSQLSWRPIFIMIDFWYACLF